MNIEQLAEKLASHRFNINNQLSSVCENIPSHKPKPNHYQEVDMVRGDKIKVEPISWVWPGYLASGKLHVLAGAPGTGKTTLSLSIASTLTKGDYWPDGEKSSVGNVVIWSGEDDPSDTLAPRLVLSGAEMSRVYFVNGVITGSEVRAFDPAKDLQFLRNKLLEIGDVRLLVVDPIVSAVTGNGNNNSEVRRALQPLVDLASEVQCAVLGITHLSKGTVGRNPIERLNGSLAYGALARIVLIAASYTDENTNNTKRAFIRVKSNIGSDEGGFEYFIEQESIDAVPGLFASYATWGNPIVGPARSILADMESVDMEQTSQLSDAKSFLYEFLEEGEKPSSEIKGKAREVGIKLRTLQRARTLLKIQDRRDGFGGQTIWMLPQKIE